MRALVAGAGGQFGRALADGCDVTAATRAALDITDGSRVRTAVADARPAVIVNCAAYNAVDDAEDDVAGALAVNAFGLRSLLRAAAAAPWTRRASDERRTGGNLDHIADALLAGREVRAFVDRSCRRATSADVDAATVAPLRAALARPMFQRRSSRCGGRICSGSAGGAVGPRVG